MLFRNPELLENGYGIHFVIAKNDQNYEFYDTNIFPWCNEEEIKRIAEKTIGIYTSNGPFVFYSSPLLGVYPDPFLLLVFKCGIVPQFKLKYVIASSYNPITQEVKFNISSSENYFNFILKKIYYNAF